MPSHNLQIFTFLAANLIFYAPGALSQGIPGFPELTGLPDLTGLDKCAVTCSMSAYTASIQACPVMTDLACFCKNQDFIRISKACMAATCPTDFLPQAAAFATKTCASVGVTLPASVTANPNLVPVNPAPLVTVPTTIPAVTVNQIPTIVNPNPTTTSAITIPTPVAPQVPVPVTLTSVGPIPTPTSVANTPATPINVANYPTFDKPVVNEPKASDNTPATSSPAIQKATGANGTQDSSDSTESSGSSSAKATGLFMIGTTLAILVML